MTWETQGRQQRGWFGHGTEDLFQPDNVADRIDAMARTVISHVPRAERHRDSLTFDDRRLRRLRTAMRDWMSARQLGRAAFEARFPHLPASGAAISKLRAAAEGARTATTHAELAQASADLADAMQDIGPDRWLRFLDTAAGRVEPAHADAQAAAVPPEPVGRYVAPDPLQWIRHPPVGDGECVALARTATGAPPSAKWPWMSRCKATLVYATARSSRHAAATGTTPGMWRYSYGRTSTASV
jgi:hypothetical protein